MRNIDTLEFFNQIEALASDIGAQPELALGTADEENDECAWRFATTRTLTDLVHGLAVYLMRSLSPDFGSDDRRALHEAITAKSLPVRDLVVGGVTPDDVRALGERALDLAARLEAARGTAAA